MSHPRKSDKSLLQLIVDVVANEQFEYRRDESSVAPSPVLPQPTNSTSKIMCELNPVQSHDYFVKGATINNMMIASSRENLVKQHRADVKNESCRNSVTGPVTDLRPIIAEIEAENMAATGANFATISVRK